MDLAKQKEAAAAFLRALDKLDPATLANLVSDNFEFEMMGRLPGVKPILGKHKFLSNMPKTLITLFPNGLNMKLLTVVAEGSHVAIQAESDIVADNGKKYANRYHFYFLFDGDRIPRSANTTTSTWCAKSFSAERSGIVSRVHSTNA